MTKFVLIVLLALASSTAMAEWGKIGNRGNTTTHVDRATIHKTGDIVEMWNLFDFKTARNDYFSPTERLLSQKVKAGYDCQMGRTRILAISGHAGNMASGKSIYSVFDVGEWEPVPADGIVRTLWSTACGK